MSKEILHSELWSLLNEAEGRFALATDKKKWIRKAQKLKGRFISEGRNYANTPNAQAFDFGYVWDTNLSRLKERGVFEPKTFEALDEIRKGL